MAKRKVTVLAVVPSKYGGHLALGHTGRNAVFFPHNTPVEMEVEMDDEYQVELDEKGKVVKDEMGDPIPVLDSVTGERLVKKQSDYHKLVGNKNLRVEFVLTSEELMAKAAEVQERELAAAQELINQDRIKRGLTPLEPLPAKEPVKEEIESDSDEKGGKRRK